MIKSLGVKKVLVLLCLFVLLGSLYFYGVSNLGGEIVEKTRQLNARKLQLATVTQNINDLKLGIEKFEVQRDKFVNLNALGFFDTQDRLLMRSRLNAIQSESGLLSLNYNISPAVTEENEKAAQAGHKIFNTPISFEFNAMKDVEIYKLIYFLNYGLPGHVTINRLQIDRVSKITPTLLQRLGVGEEVAIIKGAMDVTLRTLIVDPNASSEIDNNVRRLF